VATAAEDEPLNPLIVASPGPAVSQRRVGALMECARWRFPLTAKGIVVCPLGRVAFARVGTAAMGRKMSSAARSKQQEIDDNFEFFRQKLPDLLKDHRNRYVLLRDKKIVGIYDTVRDAQTTAENFYKDGLYSIQQVTDVAIDLGYFSHAVCVG